MAGGPVPSDSAEFWRVCVPVRERLELRRELVEEAAFRNWEDTNSWGLLLLEFIVRHLIGKNAGFILGAVFTCVFTFSAVSPFSTLATVSGRDSWTLSTLGPQLSSLKA